MHNLSFDFSQRDDKYKKIIEYCREKMFDVKLMPPAGERICR